MKASLFGFGRFGKLFYEYFKDKFSFSIYDKYINEKEIKRISKQKNITPHSIEESDIIFLAVPISSIQIISKELKTKVHPNSMIVELCSVKEYPLKVLYKYFPNNEIVGIHPLFGPDSVVNTLEDHQVIIVSKNYKSKIYNYLFNSLKEKKIKIFKMSAEEHDRLMAYTLCLTQFLGNALALIKLPEKKIGTKGYFHLYDLVERTKRDKIQLFFEMNKYNKFSKAMRRIVLDNLEYTNSFLDKLNKDFFIKNIYYGERVKNIESFKNFIF